MSIRGKKREEYVREWLEGKENPDVEVIPTKKEGKYIVRERVKNSVAESEDQNTKSQDEKTELNNTEKNTTPEPENNIVPESDVKNNNPGIGLEILEQLKLLNEYKQKKLEKKAKKKEIKKVIRKEFVKNKVLVENSDESDEDTVYVPPPEPQKIYIQKPSPIRTRRKINLLDRYK